MEKRGFFSEENGGVRNMYLTKAAAVFVEIFFPGIGTPARMNLRCPNDFLI